METNNKSDLPAKGLEVNESPKATSLVDSPQPTENTASDSPSEGKSFKTNKSNNKKSVNLSSMMKKFRIESSQKITTWKNRNSAHTSRERQIMKSEIATRRRMREKKFRRSRSV